jgi:hypothetical protein
MSEPIKDSYVYEEGENGYHADHGRDSHDWDYEQKFRRGEALAYSPDDKAIYEKVCTAIFRDRLLGPNEVTVEVKEGVVTLSGLVSDRKTKDYIAHYLEDIYGVVDIINELKVKPDHGLVGDMEWPI